MIKFHALLLMLQLDVGEDIIVSCQADIDGMKFIFRWMESGWVKHFTVRISVAVLEQEDLEMVLSAIRSFYPKHGVSRVKESE